jgi:thiol:disulfide interchange protein DsbC
MKCLRSAMGAAPLLLLAAASLAAPVPKTSADAVGRPSAALADEAVSSNPEAAAANIPGIRKEDVQPTPVPGVFEVRRGADIVYMSGDGQYVFTGDLYDVPGHRDLTESHRRQLRQKLIAAIPESKMVIFSPPQPKYTVTVFTDVDCAYCRELHRQIADYNRLGVRVRYIFYPRTGPNTDSWRKAEQVWCSPDRRSALTRAKLGEALEVKPCAGTPVAEEYALGRAIGLQGTPGIVASDGAMVGGYLPPQLLVQRLEAQQKEAP